MRSLADATASWNTFERQSSLNELRRFVHDLNGVKVSPVEGLRSAIWKAFLITKTMDVQWWPEILAKARETYNSHKTRFMHPLMHSNEQDSLNDPLSDAPDSPWATLRKDEEVRQVILQDVERCLPENLYFQKPTTQRMLVDILFVWSKLNPEIGYRQGMHEVLAFIVGVVERDVVSTRSSSTDYGASTLRRVYYKESIEHDSFLMFEAIMLELSSAYQVPKRAMLERRGSKQKSQLAPEPPIVTRAKNIIDSKLSKVDPPLAGHLQSLEIPPQLFVMRWIRLLFGREFSFDSTLDIWDGVIAEGVNDDVVDLICVSMLLRIRWSLIGADYDEALTLLLRYPELPTDHPPRTLVKDALYLRHNMTYDGGCHIIHQRTKRSPAFKTQSPSSVHEDSQISASPKLDTTRSPRASYRRSKTHFEGLLKGTARGVYAQGEEWGVNKALRDAAGEMRRNFTQMRNNDYAIDKTRLNDSDALLQTVDKPKARNKLLANMLGSALEDLWKQHETSFHDGKPEDQETKSFTTAIAKVQLVQVYLSNSSLPILQEDTGQPPAVSSSTTKAVQSSMNDLDSLRSRSATRAASESSEPQITSPSKVAVEGNEAGVTTTAPERNLQKPNRPSLEHSSFSWMVDTVKASEKQSLHGSFVPSSTKHRGKVRESDPDEA